MLFNHLYFNRLKSVIIIVLLNLPGFTQDFSINKIEPPNWWVGMKLDTLQLMVYGDDLENVGVRSVNDGLKVLGIQFIQNPSYLFINIKISEKLIDGDYDLIFYKYGIEKVIPYQILEREVREDIHQGFCNEDVIYLIFADRFCDGNPLNNTMEYSKDKFTSEDINGRKGGDIDGIISKLDYLEELGITTIWITPLLENDMSMSYHGYAATDLYKIDPRFGNNELYKNLVEEAHKRGLKIILDHVSNHIGINHPWVSNPPTKDWFHGTQSDHLAVSHDKIACARYSW